MRTGGWANQNNENDGMNVQQLEYELWEAAR
jgi:hypothetical protein